MARIRGQDDLSVGPPVFSPDSRRLAYGTGRSPYDLDRLVVDGQHVSAKGRVQERSLAFSPDSRRVAHVIEKRRGFLWLRTASSVVIDGQKGTRYDSIAAPLGEGGVIFDSPDQLHYIGRKDNAFYLVEERLGDAEPVPTG